MTARTVLVLSEHEDPEAAYVADTLTARSVPVAWFDTASFPARTTVTVRLDSGGWRGEITSPDGTVDLDDVAAVYYRQSQPFTFPASLTEPEQRFATVEARFGFGGLFMSLPVRWVSHPARVADAEYRPLQMATAARCGLTTPASILTNDPDAAHGFATESGTVYKATMHKLISEADDVKLIYTTPADPTTMADRIATTLHLFQANVPKSHEVRLVATGAGHLHAIAITTDSPAARQDFRTGYDTLAYERVDVPPGIAQSCHPYLHTLGLRLGVFDFSVTSDGTWWFLECGPASQWAWLQDMTGAPIAAAIADTLTGDPA